jgi:hypothetical protein
MITLTTQSSLASCIRCLLRLYQPPKEGELGGLPVLFAVCPVKLGDGRYMQHYVEHVMDSSRYFVLRCEVRACQITNICSIYHQQSSMWCNAFVIRAVLSFAAHSNRQFCVSDGLAHQLQLYRWLRVIAASCTSVAFYYVCCVL